MGVFSSVPTLRPVSNCNLVKLCGTWYEIQHTNNKCLLFGTYTHATLTIVQTESEFRLADTFLNANLESWTYHARLRFFEQHKNTGSLHAIGDDKNLDIDGYNVYMTDYVNYAVIGDSMCTTLRIFSRTRCLSQCRLGMILETLKSHHINICHFHGDVTNIATCPNHTNDKRFVF